MRGVLLISAIIVGLLIVAYWMVVLVCYVAQWIRKVDGLNVAAVEPDAPDPRFVSSVLREGALDPSASVVRRIRFGWFGLMGLAGAALIGISMFLSWHALAFALAVVAATGAALRYLYKRPEQTRPSLVLIVITLLVACTAGIAWQLQPPVRVQTVRVIPLPGATGLPEDLTEDNGRTPVPYFGETSDHVFVAEVFRLEDRFAQTADIVEIQRDEVRLIFEKRRGTLYEFVRPPACAVLPRAVTDPFLRCEPPKPRPPSEGR